MKAAWKSRTGISRRLRVENTFIPVRPRRPSAVQSFPGVASRRRRAWSVSGSAVAWHPTFQVGPSFSTSSSPVSPTSSQSEQVSVESKDTNSFDVSAEEPETISDTLSTHSNNSSSRRGLYRLLSSQQRELLSQQRQVVASARSLARQVGIPVPTASSSLLQDLLLEAQLAVVVTGEFNAGKSTLLNALLGKKVMESGSLPTTDIITVVTNEVSSSSTSSQPMGIEIKLDKGSPLLEDLTLIDTPGTNSTWLDHTERTLRLLPEADLILFVTSADRPFSDSEKKLLQQIQAYRKQIVVIINKMDILDASGGDHGQQAKDEIVNFVTDQASSLLGARPIVIPLSSRDALSAKLMGTQDTSSTWKRSNFEELESFLKDTLTTETKLRSKLTSPLGVAEGSLAQCLQHLAGELENLQSDIATLALLQSQFDGWTKEMQADLSEAQRLAVSEVQREGDRCARLLQRMPFVSFHRWALLDASSSLENEWDQAQQTTTKAMGSRRKSRDSSHLEHVLLEMVEDTAASIATRGRAQGQAVIEYLGKRPALQNQSLVGSVTAASQFEDTRQTLTERLSGAVKSTLQTKSMGEAKGHSEDAMRIHIASSLRQVGRLSGILQMGAIGTLLALVGQAVDPISGLAVASSLGMASGMTYSMGTSRVQKEYQSIWLERASDLGEALDVICTKELDRVQRRILDGIAPYTRFVETEQSRIQNLQEQCEALVVEAQKLRNRISKR